LLLALAFVVFELAWAFGVVTPFVLSPGLLIVLLFPLDLCHLGPFGFERKFFAVVVSASSHYRSSFVLSPGPSERKSKDIPVDVSSSCPL
jgi:hypothetical protein